MSDIQEKMLQYGAIGVFLFLCVLAIIRQYRDGKAAEKAHEAALAAQREAFTKNLEAIQKKLDDSQARHEAEMKAFAERYITKADTWMAKYEGLASSLKDWLTSVERMYMR